MERQASLSSAPTSSQTLPTGLVLDPSSSSSTSSLQPEPKQCSHCKMPAPLPSPSADDDEEVAGEKGLKPCSKCHTALYCSRECMKAGWKVHKKTCAADAQKYAFSVKEKPAAPPRVPKKEGHRGGLQKWQFDT